MFVLIYRLLLLSTYLLRMLFCTWLLASMCAPFDICPMSLSPFPSSAVALLLTYVPLPSSPPFFCNVKIKNSFSFVIYFLQNHELLQTQYVNCFPQSRIRDHSITKHNTNIHIRMYTYIFLYPYLFSHVYVPLPYDCTSGLSCSRGSFSLSRAS